MVPCFFGLVSDAVAARPTAARAISAKLLHAFAALASWRASALVGLPPSQRYDRVSGFLRAVSEVRVDLVCE